MSTYVGAPRRPHACLPGAVAVGTAVACWLSFEFQTTPVLHDDVQTVMALPAMLLAEAFAPDSTTRGGGFPMHGPNVLVAAIVLYTLLAWPACALARGAWRRLRPSVRRD